MTEAETTTNTLIRKKYLRIMKRVGKIFSSERATCGQLHQSPRIWVNSVSTLAIRC